MRNLLLTFGLVYLRADASVQDVIATQTTYDPTNNHDLAPSPTEAALIERAEAIAPNICGFFMGTNYWAWFYNNQKATCYWNSDAKIVGADSVPKTNCVDGAQLSTSSCSTCPADLQCSSTAPYCGTFYYSTDYHAYICTSDPNVTFQLQPTWSSMTDVINFPIYTGINGISTGTQYPLGYPTPTDTGTTMRTTPSESAPTDLNSLSSSNPLSTSSSTPPSTTSSTSNSKSVPVGAIVGGVIGGVAVIAIFAFAVIFFVVRSRRQRQGSIPSHQLPQGKFGNSGPNSLPPMQLYHDPSTQAYNQPSGFPQGGLAPHLLPNQQIKPELDSHTVNQAGVVQGVSVSPSLQNQPTPPPPPPQQPTQPELDSFNRPALPQQQPIQPELDSRNQPAFSLQHPIQSELDSHSQMTLPQYQPVSGELDSHTQSDMRQGAYQQPNQTALPHYQPSQAELEHPNRGPQQLGHNAGIYEAP